MKKHTIANNFLYYLFCGFSGAVVSLIVWLFLKLMNYGIHLLWNVVPSNIDFKFYTLIVCTVGGIVLGIWQKYTNAIPDELDEVMKKVKKDKFYPYNRVLFLCVSALLPLVFGGSIGPEAGLTGVIVGLCYWAGSHMKDAKSKIPELMEVGISATLMQFFMHLYLVSHLSVKKDLTAKTSLTLYGQQKSFQILLQYFLPVVLC